MRTHPAPAMLGARQAFQAVLLALDALGATPEIYGHLDGRAADVTRSLRVCAALAPW
jgi:hypothetical protein